MTVKIKRTEGAHIPTRGSAQAAGYDLYANETVQIDPHETTVVSTGVSVEIPDGYFGAIFARSGLATREGIRPANCVGVIDSDYRGEIKVAAHNDSNFPKTIKKGERIAQLVVIAYLPVEFEETDSLSDTERGAGGFGSTGKA